MVNNKHTHPASGPSRDATARSAAATDTRYTVTMHPDLVDDLDEGFSPMDGLVAIDEMFGELPLLHRAVAPTRLRKRTGRTLRVYRGCYDWYKSLGFSYVQIGTTLHVLELWYKEHPELSDVDVILGTGRTEGYTPFDTDQPVDEEPESSADSPF